LALSIKRVLLSVGLRRTLKTYSKGAPFYIASPYRNVWSAAVLQAKNEEWQLVCANVFGLQWSQGLRAMMDFRSLSSS
jgi:hypothetical protein